MAHLKNDLSGKVFKKFSVIEEIIVPYKGIQKNKKTIRKLKCLCNCGRIFYPYKINVCRGATTACMNCANKKDMAGKKIGKFSVIKEIVDSKKTGKIYLVRCDCGHEFEKTSSLLRNISGATCKNCRPVKKPTLSKKERAIITGHKKHMKCRNRLIGNTFGDLKVLSFSHYEIEHGRKRYFYWAKCVCKKILPIRTDHFGYVQSCGCSRRKRMPRGEKMSQALLKNKEVRSIKHLLLLGSYKQKEIAKMFGVSEGVVSSIKTGKCWVHIK